MSTPQGPRAMQPACSTVADLLNPRSVAVIGASEDQTKFGGRLFRMLIEYGYAGTIYPINPGRPSLFGLPAYPSIAATPEPPDMVVMALPQPKVKAEIEAAAARGTRGGIIITAKFSDAGAEGAALEREIVRAARAHGMRLIGPNCLGVISPANRVVLCSSPTLDVDTLPVGSIGFVSQSGALMATIFDRALDVNVGFSHCVSVGNQADLEGCDFVEYLIDDSRTQVICTYIEGLRDPGRFARLARRAREAGKPWLAVKAGRTEAGSRAAFLHTASIAGSHAVLASVCRDENVTLLEDIGAMIALAAAMARHPGGRKFDEAIDALAHRGERGRRRGRRRGDRLPGRAEGRVARHRAQVRRRQRAGRPRRRGRGPRGLRRHFRQRAQGRARCPKSGWHWPRTSSRSSTAPRPRRSLAS